MAHALDRPVWETLTGAHAHLCEGGALAKRFRPDVNIFAAAIDNSPKAGAALAALVPPGEKIAILQVPAIVAPEGFAVLGARLGVQMMAPRAFDPPSDPRIRPLAQADAGDMLSLATLTEPGPFVRNTYLMGRFVGIRIDGRLAAMAGERMRAENFVEVSGVCVHPDHRGAGLARLLSLFVAARLQAEGKTPFLHAFASNDAAIALYTGLGFVHRADVNVAMLQRIA